MTSSVWGVMRRLVPRGVARRIRGRNIGLSPSAPSDAPERPTCQRPRTVGPEHERWLGFEGNAGPAFHLDHAVPSQHLTGARHADDPALRRVVARVDVADLEDGVVLERAPGSGRCRWARARRTARSSGARRTALATPSGPGVARGSGTGRSRARPTASTSSSSSPTPIRPGGSTRAISWRIGRRLRGVLEHVRADDTVEGLIRRTGAVVRRRARSRPCHRRRDEDRPRDPPPRPWLRHAGARRSSRPIPQPRSSTRLPARSYGSVPTALSASCS